jgi:hypothetical protein
LALLAFAPLLQAGDITGQVTDSISGLGVEGAFVSLQAAGIKTTTASDGSFTLSVADGTGLVLVAAKKGYYHGSITVASPSTGVPLVVEPVTVGNNPNYSFMDPGMCGACHPDQWSQWTDSPMNKAGTNTWLYDIFDGSGSPGGMGGFVYARDSVYAANNPASECASCHQPEPWIEQPFSALEPLGNLSQGSLHGVSCEVCHKIAGVDETQVNYPGLFPGAVTFNRPDDPLIDHQVEYGVLGDVSYVSPVLMRPSYQPQLVAEVCAVCHQDKNDPDEDHEFEEANGVISEPTYLEWLASPYADPQSQHYASCVTCHMPAYGATQVAQVFGETLPLRDPETIRSHRIEGTTAQFLENAVELSVESTRDATGIDVQVTIDNTLTGHHVPTGVTVRNMILLVEAERTADGAALVSLGTQVVHNLGGVGDPAQGYYAGLPGKFYAKHNHNRQGVGPTFFTDATGIVFDNRIPALASDQTQYRFAAPAGTGEVRVRARLVYRRAFRFVVDAKQWTTDGHGQPLEDVQAPHFGHLMEDVSLHSQEPGPGMIYCSSSPNSTGAPARMSATGTSSIAAADLVLVASNIPASTFGLFFFGTATTSQPLGNGLRCVDGIAGRFPVIGPTIGPVQTQAVNPPNLPNNTNLQPGDVLHFQFWFRDTAGGGAQVDLSDGYTVTFAP